MIVRICRLVTLFLFCSLLVAPGFADQGGQKWAILIGVDRYQNAEQSNRLPTLVGAVADAKGLAKTLIDVAGFDPSHVIVLTTDPDGMQPRRNVILREMEKLKSRVKPGDTLFVFYSGHGCEDKETGTTYLLPCDAESDTVSLLKETALPLDLFAEPLHHLPLKLLVVALDMCRIEVGRADAGGATDTMQTGHGLDFAKAAPVASAPAAGGSITTAAGAPVASVAVDSPRVVVKWWSCSPSQKSYEMEQQKRGYFSYYFEQALRGKAAVHPGDPVTLADVGNYLPGSVQREVARVEGEQQVPRLLFDGVSSVNDLSQFVFVPAGAVAAVAVAAPVAAPAAPGIDVHAGLQITTNVSEANVAVDGSPLPQNIDYVTDLAGSTTKSVRVTVSALGYHDLTRDVAISRGVVTPLYLRLSLESEVRSRAAAAKHGIADAVSHDLPTVLDAFHTALQNTADALAVPGKAPAKDRATLMAMIARAQAEAGDSAASRLTCARAVAEAQTGDPSTRPAALAAIVKASIAAADIAGAAVTARSIADTGVRAMSLADVAAAQVAAADVVGARDSIGLALTAAAGMRSETDKASFLTKIVVVQTQMDDRDDAVRTIRFAADAARSSATIYGLKVRDLLAQAQAQILTGNVDDARNTVQLAYDALQSVEDMRNTVHAYALVAEGQAETGDRDNSLKTVQYALQTTLNAGDSAVGVKAEELTTIAVAQAVIGDLDGVKQTLQLADQEVKSGRPSYAIVQGLAHVARAQTLAGGDQDAADTIRSMVQTADHVEDGVEKSDALALIAVAQLAHKDTDAARATLQAALLSARLLPTVMERAQALTRIADAIARNN